MLLCPFKNTNPYSNAKLGIFSEVKIRAMKKCKRGNLHLASETSTTSIIFADFMTSYFLLIKKPSPSASIIGCIVSTNSSLLYIYYKGRQLWKIFFFKLHTDFLWLHPLLYKLSKLQNSTRVLILCMFIDILCIWLKGLKKIHTFKVFYIQKVCLRRSGSKELCNGT